jgi:hypothetical protein
LVQHHEFNLEQVTPAAIASGANPLHEQYLTAIGGGPGTEAVQTPAAATTTTRPTDASPTTTQPTAAKPGSVDEQVDREYQAGMNMFHNPNGGSQQLMQTLGQFGTTPGDDPTYKAWMGGYTADQIKQAALEEQLAAGPPLGLAAYLFQNMPGVARGISQLTQQYDQQVQSQAGGGSSSDSTTQQTSDPQPQDQTAQSAVDPIDAANPTDATATAQPVSETGQNKPQLRPAVLRRPINTGASQDILQEAEQNFITQEHSQWNTNADYANKDCGPTSLAMALKQLGVVQPGENPAGAEQLISTERQLMTNNDNHQQDTDTGEMAAAAARYGVYATNVTGLQGINAALDHGGVVISGGDPSRAWGPRLGNDYLRVNGQPWSGSHLVCVNGIDKNTGNYIVSDPLSKRGVIEVTPTELQNFFGAATAGSDSTGTLHGGLALFPPDRNTRQQAPMVRT